ncbi:hypothetical protein FNV43_RR23369 [Rhamnella rubrinervis]|uniref:FLZ-type domain-containing protein n=1 Tax=Rhamnella rubrinervis TaxID=2594499 RepID=A0A8K0DRV7_9ROSA|nr:hypothetical protein FNV43_RR23369 [Rhamnella rubrinervis]
MLRNRSRAVTSKQALMADHSSQPPPPQNYTRPFQSFFNSPRFRAFTMKGFSETDGFDLISPTSILDNKPFSPLGNSSFPYNRSQPMSPKILSGNKRCWDEPEAKGIGVALLDPPNDEAIGKNFSKPSSAKLLLGTKLRVQIPTLQTSTLVSPTESPKSPADFGIKTRNSHISANGSLNTGNQTKFSPRVDVISISDMEHSEEYTCVISHGPNPRTTHIFDNCIVESFYSLSASNSNSASQNFLSYCYTCKKNLEQKNDIYIYRGEKAFCSQECRNQEMVLDGMGNTEFGDAP